MSTLPLWIVLPTAQQQEPFRSHLGERLISRKLQLQSSAGKTGLEKSARTVQTIHGSFTQNEKAGSSIDLHQNSLFHWAACYQPHAHTFKTVESRCPCKPRPAL